MARSQDIAAAVALKYLGYDVKLAPAGALVDDVARSSPAAKAGLEPTDIDRRDRRQARPNDRRPAAADLAAQAGRHGAARAPGTPGLGTKLVETTADPRAAGRDR